MVMKRILSGIQPTGQLHLGNYLGALKNWVSLQDQYECFFCIVDLHALTTHPAPQELRRQTLETGALYIAAGVNPETSTIFHQSAIPAHTELMWLLSCYTPLGWLNRMTQFKEKAGKDQGLSVLGLYSYPVLMAADILMYDAQFVPVGEDQKQHIELTRDLAISLNQRYKRELFQAPEPMIFGAATRVMSLKDGLKKMSKSDSAENSRIGLFDSNDVIMQKIKRAKTDMDPFPTVYDAKMPRPEILNLIQIYGALTNLKPQAVCDAFGGQGFAEFKTQLGEVVVGTIGPIRDRFQDIMKSPDYVAGILAAGAEKAGRVATKKLALVKECMGLL